MFRLDNRVVVLTGAGGYLGRAMSRAIVDAGAELIMCGRRPEKLDACRKDLPADLQVRCHVVPVDVSSDGDLERLRRYVEERFGRLHGLVNNAYSGQPGTIDTVGASDFRTACDLNLVAPFVALKTLRALLERGAVDCGTSAVVNISSMYGCVSPDPRVYGDSGSNNPPQYGATKAGMMQLTRYLACHLGPSGIRVNTLAPGPFPEPSGDPTAVAFRRRLASRVPMKRVGQPREVAGPVVFLLSEASSYVNGASLSVDGGWTAW